jgi:hypothetical protein
MYWLKAYPIQSLQTFSLQKFCVTHYKKKDLFRYDFSRKTLETQEMQEIPEKSLFDLDYFDIVYCHIFNTNLLQVSPHLEKQFGVYIRPKPN